jgi:calcineurin-like phosphoesterase family protein
MSKIYLISDTHFGHENIIQYCGRPFANAELMDECLVDNWNSVVGRNDIIYHLGDVYLGNGASVIPRLNGRKRLILGNHDFPNDPILWRHFERITIWQPMPLYGVILSHMPLLDRGQGGGDTYKEFRNIHGHIHNKPAPTEHHVNISVEWTDYRPIELDSVAIH